jgi:hypothetical protein
MSWYQKPKRRREVIDPDVWLDNEIRQHEASNKAKRYYDERTGLYRLTEAELREVQERKEKKLAKPSPGAPPSFFIDRHEGGPGYRGERQLSSKRRKAARTLGRKGKAYPWQRT